MKIDSSFIQVALMSYYGTPSDILIPNYYIGRYEADLYKITKAGITTEFEIKVSKSDFLADFKKGFKVWRTDEFISKHSEIVAGKRTNKFYFVVPEGLIIKEEVPDYAGLIYCYESGYLKVIKNCKLLTKVKAFEKNPNLYEHLLYNLVYRERNANRELRMLRKYHRELEEKYYNLLKND